MHSKLKILSHMPARNDMELDYGSHLDDGPASCWLNRSPEVVLSNFYIPPSNASRACLKYEIREPTFEVGGSSPILCIQCDSTYGFQSKRYGSLAYNQLKELDDLHYPKKVSDWKWFTSSSSGLGLWQVFTLIKFLGWLFSAHSGWYDRCKRLEWIILSVHRFSKCYFITMVPFSQL